ncbi:hypothetical protein OGAPHI_002171 [Ogataea philodendri]|uniref:DUF654-domain-containing protein n=1 Tax=Ogataea philodendri TaxID=1378263 RepID=A0A9P8PAH2_9ASCO|nr:uncharacterized protein OGAPHI_002171 [Ogataea philodendri]KAH3668417.1 hypothetical protein OGAPHI_002171 [Ogataea philodendri]
MSNRALRRLQKKELEVAESDDEYTPVAQHTAVNAFQLLGGEDDDESEDTDSETIPVSSKPAPVSGKTSSKKKKNKAKKPATADEQDIDQILAELQLSKQSVTEETSQEPFNGPYDDPKDGAPELTAARLTASIALLQFDPRDLDPDREFESVFGKLSTAAVDDADATPSTFVSPDVLKQIKLLSKRVRGWCGRDRRSIPGTSRKLVMCKIRDDWIPTPKKPLSMDMVPDEPLMFRVVETPAYPRAITTQFYLSTVIRPDHEALIHLLQQYPYHLETILQVTSILQRQGDNSNTNGLIERALFVFDWSLRTNFQLGSGDCRLPFDYFLNRQCYLTVFKYITVLTQKSTFFTALNYCKLLFSFDPANDPYGVRYFIDFYAIMAGEDQYLIDFAESYLVKTYKEWYTPSLAYSLAISTHKVAPEDASAALLRAYQTYPYTGQMVLNKLSNYPEPSYKVSDYTKLATAVYLARIQIMLEEPATKNWFVAELEKVVRAQPKAKQQFDCKTIPDNLLRHVILSNETSAMARIPASFWKENEIFEFDVLPPTSEKSTSIFDHIDQARVSNAIIHNSLEQEEERQIAELIRRTADEAN